MSQTITKPEALLAALGLDAQLLPAARAANETFALRVPANIPQELNFYPFVRDKDAVVLELDTVDRRPVANFPLAQVEEWDSISVPALFVDDDVLSKAIDSSRPDQVTQAIREGSAVEE